MKDLKTINKGITHAGKFHTDDVISTAFLKFFNENIEIERLYENEGEGNDDEFVYDIGLGTFDHHQEERELDDIGFAYCAFGKIWEAYGKEYLKENGFENIEEAFQKFKDLYVYKMDQGDNGGYKGLRGFYENQIIIGCNPLWFEDADAEMENRQFDKAVTLGRELLRNWTRNVYRLVEDHNIAF